MATEKHGIELGLKSNIDKALGSAAQAARSARTAVNSVGTAAKSSFETAGAAVVVFNQGLELAKKGIELFRATVGASIETALQFRKQGDEMVTFFQDFKRETELVSARMGDALLPVFRGFIEATQAATGKISDLIAENQKLIGSTLIEWIAGASKLLVTGLARAADAVGKIFYGWRMIIAGVQVVVNEFFKVVLEQISNFLGKAASVADMLGASGIAGAARDAQKAAQGLYEQFDKGSKDAQGSIQDSANNLGKLERTIVRLEGTVKSVIEDGMVRAQKHVQEATKGTTKTIEEQAAAIEKLKEAKEKAESKGPGEAPAAAGAEGPGAGMQIAGAVAGAAGAVGNVAMGFATGGPIGGIVAVVGEAVAQSETLQRVFAKLNKAFSKAIEALEPVFQALEPIIDIVIQHFTPTIEFLAKVLAKVASVILKVIGGLAEAWNGIVKAITWVFRKLGDISIFGKRPLGFMKDWAEGIERAALINTAALDAAGARLAGTMNETAGDIKKGADTVKDTVDDMSRQMVGVPGIMKVALHEFRAAEAAGGGGVAMMAASGGGAFEGLRSGMARSGVTIQTGSINITGVEDPDKLWDTVQSRARIEGVESSGVNSMAVGPGGNSMSVAAMANALG